MVNIRLHSIIAAAGTPWLDLMIEPVSLFRKAWDISTMDRALADGSEKWSIAGMGLLDNARMLL